MSKKQDIIDALNCREPRGSVPIWELEFHVWDAASGKHVILGPEFEKLSPAKQERALQTNADIFVQVCQELHHAAVTCPAGYWNVGPGQLAYFILPGDYKFKQVEALKRICPKDLLIAGNTGGVIGMPGADNYVQFAYKLYDAPQDIDKQAQDTLQAGLANVRRMKDCGADIVFTASDLADNHGPFYNPEQMRRFVYPYLADFAKEVKKLGLFSVIHTDGNLNDCVKDIAATGIHAMQAVDPVAGMDLKETLDKVRGKMCLVGNVDCGILLTSTPDRIYEDVRAKLQTCKSFGGWVLGASNAVQPEVPMQNYRAMIQAWVDYGKYA